MNTKPIYTSKTFWANIAAIAIMVMESGEFTSIIPDAWVVYIPHAIALANLGLRMVTKTAVTLK